MAPTPNARGLFEGGPGYLYAVVAEHLGTAHVKLGSTAAADPVAALHARYATPLGRPTVLWTMPSAHRLRDERTHMHGFFAAYRLYEDRELFDFRPIGALAELRETLLFFQYTLRDEIQAHDVVYDRPWGWTRPQSQGACGPARPERVWAQSRCA